MSTTGNDNTTSALVGVVMGSQSDWSTMKEASIILDDLGIDHETKIVSAHRTPDRLWEYGTSAAERGLKVIIAGPAAPLISRACWRQKPFCRSSGCR